MLSRLGFQFPGRLEIGHQGQMDVEAVFLADVERKLADRLQKRQALDVADCTADFRDDDIDWLMTARRILGFGFFWHPPRSCRLPSCE